MKRSNGFWTLLLPLALAACGGTDVVATVAIDVHDPESDETVERALPGVEVQLLPYDRDVIFDSLAEAAAADEPEVPEEIQEIQDSIRFYRDQWQEADARWSVLRDTLQNISQELRRLNRGEGRYRVLFRDFQDMEGQFQRVEDRRDDAFERFTELQRSVAQQTQELRIRREQWEEEAFSDAPQVIQARIEESRRQPRVDTTNAEGVVRFRGVRSGEWWLHARNELPYSELYWNVPVEVEGDVARIRLDRDNAEVRPKL